MKKYKSIFREAKKVEVGAKVVIKPVPEMNNKSVKGTIISIEDEYYRIEFDTPQMIYGKKTEDDLFMRNTFKVI